MRTGLAAATLLAAACSTPTDAGGEPTGEPLSTVRHAHGLRWTADPGGLALPLKVETDGASIVCRRDDDGAPIPYLVFERAEGSGAYGVYGLGGAKNGLSVPRPLRGEPIAYEGADEEEALVRTLAAAGLDGARARAAVEENAGTWFADGLRVLLAVPASVAREWLPPRPGGPDGPLLVVHELPTDTRLRVVAYNVKHGRGMDGVVDLERSAAVIRAQGADVVTLQEVDDGCARSGGVDQAARLGELCGMEHAFGPFMDYDGGRYGMALLSRHPIVEVTNHALPPGPEPRTALAARVDVGGREVVVVGVHLYGSEDERLAQARAMDAALAGETAPVLLAGDFNSRRGDGVTTFLERGWTNPVKDGAADTFPSDTPDREIDFVLLRVPGGFDVREHVVVDEPEASDHRPVVLDVLLRGE